MKTIIKNLIIIQFVFFGNLINNYKVFSQQPQIGDTINSFTVTSGYPKVLKMGMLNFGDTIHIDETEILIMEWLDFIYYQNPEKFPSFLRKQDLSQEEKDRLRRMEIDSSLLPMNKESRKMVLSILSKDILNREIKEFTFLQTDYYFPLNQICLENTQSMEKTIEILNTPITGISYEQALLYCRWRTKLDSLRVFDKNYQVTKFGQKEFFALKYTLLSPQEFDAFIPNRDSVTMNGKWSTFNYKNAGSPKKEKLKIINRKYGSSLLRYGAYYYYSNRKERLIDIQGNAAEMTNIKGIAKGGSFDHPASESLKGVINKYNTPKVWLGFRCCARQNEYLNSNF